MIGKRYRRTISFFAVALVAIAANYCFLIVCCPSFSKAASHDCCPDEGADRQPNSSLECVSFSAIRIAEKAPGVIAPILTLSTLVTPAHFSRVEISPSYVPVVDSSISHDPPNQLTLALLEHSISPVAPPSLA